MKIALVGKMRSGKNTVADMIEGVLEHSYPQYTDVKQLAFGTKLKQLFELAHGRPFDKRTDRRLIQDFGQGARAILSEGVWVLPVLTESIMRDMCNQVTIVTDARQGNEIASLKRYGFKIVYVETDMTSQLKRMFDNEEESSIMELAHATELVEEHRDLFDYKIVNTKDTELHELLEQVEELVRQIESGD